MSSAVGGRAHKASGGAKQKTHKELVKDRQALDENASGIDCTMQILERTLKELNEGKQQQVSRIEDKF